MKFAIIFPILILIIGCESQHFKHPASDHENFDFKLENNIKFVKEYLRVPSTNKDSLIEPIGLMLIREYQFDKNGSLIKEFCDDCLILLHSDSPNIDYRKEMDYKNRQLQYYTEFGFDTTFYKIAYTNNQSLTKGYRNNQHGYTSIEEYDSIGRIKEQIEFDFFSSSNTHKQNVFILKTTYDYGQETIYKQYWRADDKPLTLSNIDNIDEIQKLANSLKFETSGTEVTTFSKSGKTLHKKWYNTSFPDTTYYEYSKNGLLESKMNTYNGYVYTHVYKYENW